MIVPLSKFEYPDAAARLYPAAPERPWFVEVGFGDGRFWPEYARTFGEAPNYLGVEVSGVSLLKAARRLRAAGLDNAHVTKMPADVLLRAVVPARALSGLIVNFPDPWPRAEHTEFRLLRAPFFRLAASRLREGGSVLLTTDHEEYFDFACREARESGVMRLDFSEPPQAALATKYALKWRELGLSARHVRFVPTQHPDVPGLDIHPFPEEPSAVPHAILTLPDPFDLADFQKVVARADGYTVVLLEAYRSLGRDEYTVLAHIEEGELTQEVLINVTKRQDGSTLVRLAKFGAPIITPGVKAAVGAVSDELRRRGAEVRHLGY